MSQNKRAENMRYIDTVAGGGPEVLVMKEGPRPEPASGEVLIKVFAAGVNRLDILQRQGNYPPPPGSSNILGVEVAGEIVSMGRGDNDWKKGERVCALTTGGGYAEYVAVPKELCMPVPPGMDMETAAAVPQAFFTVWSNVFDRARLKKGERFLVHGGSSGIGTTAIQMAKSMGAWVATTAGTPEKCRACEELGADLAVLYKEEDFVEAIGAATDGYGVDVILDMVGGEYVNRNLHLAAKDGRVISISFLKGSKVTIDLRQMMTKRLVMTGSTLRGRSLNAKADIALKLKTFIWPHLKTGKIKPRLFSVFPLQEAAQAHRLIESSRHIGKIVLDVTDIL